VQKLENIAFEAPSTLRRERVENTGGWKLVAVAKDKDCFSRYKDVISEPVSGNGWGPLCTIDIDTWHRQIGHLGEENVKELAEGMNIMVGTSVGVCEACFEGKQTRSTSSYSSYTRMTYIYALNLKRSAEILEQLKDYKSEVKKHAGKEIKRLRTDGGQEYQGLMARYLKDIYYS
jgi:hypothetical protein